MNCPVMDEAHKRVLQSYLRKPLPAVTTPDRRQGSNFQDLPHDEMAQRLLADLNRPHGRQRKDLVYKI